MDEKASTLNHPANVIVKHSEQDFFLSSEAIYSMDERYRFLLKRVWDDKLPLMCWVCLNPSTATELKNDPTVTRCIDYAKRWGYGGMFMMNIFAYRSTDPFVLYNESEPIGEHTDMYLRFAEEQSQLTVCGWGNHGFHKERGVNVLKQLKKPHYLDMTKWDMPKHPLYLKATLRPVLYRVGVYMPKLGIDK